MRDTLQTQMAVIATKVGAIEQKVTEISNKLEGHYVTKEEFDPIKKIVYGIVSIFLTAVVVALVGLVLRQQVP